MLTAKFNGNVLNFKCFVETGIYCLKTIKSIKNVCIFEKEDILCKF